jgi:hypothetical protein
MTGQAIFIGSSQEQKHIAEQIATRLAVAGFTPHSWWNCFPPGSYTLESLTNVAKSVDGAVWICPGEDHLWYRDEHVRIPRDNLLFEMGLFMAHVGRQRSLLLVDDKTKLPSDLAGLTSKLLTDDIPEVSHGIVRHFETAFEEEEHDPNDSVQIIEAHPDFAKQIRDQRVPGEWGQRALYIGTEGSLAWISVANSARHIPTADKEALRRQILAAIDEGITRTSMKAIRTFVSFGPGDGNTDAQIASRLVRQSWIEYVPVDLSEGLLRAASQKVDVRVPFHLLCDFEEHMRFINRRLISNNVVRPILFGLLGNTFGNLDLYEDVLKDNITNTLMKSGDYLLIEAGYRGPEWTFETDPRTSHSGYNQAMRRFIANGIARHRAFGAEQEDFDESVDDILRDYENRISYQHGQSDVPESGAIDIFYTHRGFSKVALSTRRYKWPVLERWFLERSPLECVHRSVYQIPGTHFGMGTLLFRKTGRL